MAAVYLQFTREAGIAEATRTRERAQMTLMYRQLKLRDVQVQQTVWRMRDKWLPQHHIAPNTDTEVCREGHVRFKEA